MASFFNWFRLVFFSASLKKEFVLKINVEFDVISDGLVSHLKLQTEDHSFYRNENSFQICKHSIHEMGPGIFPGGGFLDLGFTVDVTKQVLDDTLRVEISALYDSYSDMLLKIWKSFTLLLSIFFISALVFLWPLAFSASNAITYISPFLFPAVSIGLHYYVSSSIDKQYNKLVKAIRKIESGQKIESY